MIESNNLNVAILLATYNGIKYLPEQLESIEQQDYKNWKLYVSDDSPGNETYEFLQNYAKERMHDVVVKKGRQKGFVVNFLSMVTNSSIQAGFYAFADQDDIWFKNKLSRAVNHLSKIDNSIPALYCSRTKLMNDAYESLGYSPLFLKAPGFKNAFVQNIGGGNTMVFNHAARQLIASYGHNVDVCAHDWWVYLVVTGANGYVFYDDEPTVLYRQHDHNQIGSNQGVAARLIRIKGLFQGKLSQWIDQHLHALTSQQDLLSLENIKLIKEFQEFRKKNVVMRIFSLRKLGIYRQTMAGNIGLYLAAIFNKL